MTTHTPGTRLNHTRSDTLPTFIDRRTFNQEQARIINDGIYWMEERMMINTFGQNEIASNIKNIEWIEKK